MNKVRVARIITRLNVGGPAYQAALLNCRLPERGYETLLIHGQVSPGEDSFRSLLDRYPGPVYQSRRLARPIRPLRDTLALSELVGVLRRFKPDIVHTHTAKAGVLGRIAAKIAGARVLVHTYHGHVLEGYFRPAVARTFLRTEKMMARMTDRLVGISPRLTRELCDRYRLAPEARFVTLELGLDLARFLNLPPRGRMRRQSNIPDTAFVLGTLGRLVPIKNHRRMIAAFGRLTPSIPDHDLHLVIGGTGPLENELKAQARALNLDRRVHFPGLVEDLEAFYADIDLALLTSDNEGTPVTLLEAQAAGKFCVAPDVGGVGDILDARRSRLVRPNEPEAYVNVLREIILNWTQVGPADDRLRQAVVERFHPDRLTADIDTLYQTLLAKDKMPS